MQYAAPLIEKNILEIIVTSIILCSFVPNVIEFNWQIIEVIRKKKNLLLIISVFPTSPSITPFKMKSRSIPSNQLRPAL